MAPWKIRLEKQDRYEEGSKEILPHPHEFTYEFPDGWEGKEADAMLREAGLRRSDNMQRDDGTPINPADLDSDATG